MSGSALILDLAHEPADVLPGVSRQLDDLALLHALPYGVGHGDGERSTGVVGALLSGGLGAHCLPQGGNGLFGDGHACMFAHPRGHTEARPTVLALTLARGHMYVASWMCAEDP